MSNNDVVTAVAAAYSPIMNKFHSQLLNTYTNLTQQVNDQNDTIKNQIDRYSEESSPNYQKSVYEFASAETLRTIFWYLVVIFLALVVGLAVVMYFNTTLTLMEKIIIFIKVATFPVWFYAFEQLLYLLYVYLYAFVTSTLYSNVYLNQY